MLGVVFNQELAARPTSLVVPALVESDEFQPMLGLRAKPHREQPTSWNPLNLGQTLRNVGLRGSTVPYVQHILYRLLVLAAGIPDAPAWSCCFRWFRFFFDLLDDLRGALLGTAGRGTDATDATPARGLVFGLQGMSET